MTSLLVLKENNRKETYDSLEFNVTLCTSASAAQLCLFWLETRCRGWKDHCAET